MNPNGREPQMWVIRAGKDGEADRIFMEQNLVVLSDSGLGNLVNIQSSRDGFCKAYRKLHPDETRSGSAGIAGKFYRFAHEVRINDFVLYPCIKDKNVYFGRITSDYVFSGEGEPAFPHQRQVAWQGSFAKSLLSVTAQREIGAARTFFQIKTHSAEITQLIVRTIATNTEITS